MEQKPRMFLGLPGQVTREPAQNAYTLNKLQHTLLSGIEHRAAGDLLLACRLILQSELHRTRDRMMTSFSSPW